MVYKQPGEHWSDLDDPCINYVCEEKENGEIFKTKFVMNCSKCPKTAIYFPPSKLLGQCCGICRITMCEENMKLYSVGDTWTSEDQPCRKSECVEEYGTVKTLYSRKPCPEVPRNCPQNKLVKSADGCCEICNVTSEMSCSVSPMPVKDTVGFFTYKDPWRGGTCVNKEEIPGVVQCAGACHSNSFYSLDDGDFKETCKCCRVNITVNRTVELTCPDGRQIKRSYLQPETCQCSKCAPKNDLLIKDISRQKIWYQNRRPEKFGQEVQKKEENDWFATTKPERMRQDEENVWFRPAGPEQFGQVQIDDIPDPEPEHFGQEVQKEEENDWFATTKPERMRQDEENDWFRPAGPQQFGQVQIDDIPDPESEHFGQEVQKEEENDWFATTKPERMRQDEENDWFRPAGQEQFGQVQIDDIPDTEPEHFGQEVQKEEENDWFATTKPEAGPEQFGQVQIDDIPDTEPDQFGQEVQKEDTTWKFNAFKPEIQEQRDNSWSPMPVSFGQEQQDIDGSWFTNQEVQQEQENLDDLFDSNFEKLLLEKAEKQHKNW